LFWKGFEGILLKLLSPKNKKDYKIWSEDFNIREKILTLSRQATIWLKNYQFPKHIYIYVRYVYLLYAVVFSLYVTISF
jgi:hypothetical protein